MKLALALVLLVAAFPACNSRTKPTPTVSYVPASNTIPFTTIYNGTGSGPQGSDEATLVIQDQAAYAAYSNGAPPASPAVDFTTETVLAVRGRVGNQLYTLTILGVDPGATSAEATVSYTSVRSSSNAIVAQVTVPSQHVVKIAKGPTSFTFTRL
jgi:hypothetical protein